MEEKDMRDATIFADDGGDAIELIKKIPGYTLKENNNGGAPTPSGYKYYLLHTPSGDSICLIQNIEDNNIITGVIVKQDRLDGPIAPKDDELVRLRNAIKNVGGLSMSICYPDSEL